ncbi:ABC transporter permease [Mycetocola saprophilus]|uniref:ABC transporter permease n=1 Tax=Mycetocola saprophilus TaxID=76636 RepID=UPI003BF45BF1
MSTTRPVTPAAPSVLSTTWLVAEREMTQRLRSKAFLFSSASLIVLVLVGVLLSGFAAGGGFSGDEKTRVAAAGPVAAILDTKTFEVESVASNEDARALVREGKVDAAVIAEQPTQKNPTGVTVIAQEKAPDALTSALTLRPQVELLGGDGVTGPLRFFMALAFGLIFMMSAVTFGSVIAQSVVEEKSTRIVEILMSTISVRVLLAGKVLGNSLLAFAQVAAIAAVAIVGLSATGQDALLAGVGAPIIWFVVFFIFGFVLLAALFAGLASLVSRQEDVGSAITPVTMLVMIPYFGVAFFNDNPVVMTVLSYVPFSAPVGMPVRLFFGDAQWWEPLVALAILLVSVILVILLAARIYRGSLLHTGGKLKLSEALRG